MEWDGHQICQAVAGCGAYQRASQYVKGVGKGTREEAKDVTEPVRKPVETAKGLAQLPARAVNDPKGLARDVRKETEKEVASPRVSRNRVS